MHSEGKQNKMRIAHRHTTADDGAGDDAANTLVLSSLRCSPLYFVKSAAWSAAAAVRGEEHEEQVQVCAPEEGNIFCS